MEKIIREDGVYSYTENMRYLECSSFAALSSSNPRMKKEISEIDVRRRLCLLYEMASACLLDKPEDVFDVLKSEGLEPIFFEKDMKKDTVLFIRSVEVAEDGYLMTKDVDSFNTLHEMARKTGAFLLLDISTVSWRRYIPPCLSASFDFLMMDGAVLAVDRFFDSREAKSETVRYVGAACSMLEDDGEYGEIREAKKLSVANMLEAVKKNEKIESVSQAGLLWTITFKEKVSSRIFSPYEGIALNVDIAKNGRTLVFAPALDIDFEDIDRIFDRVSIALG